MRAEKPGRTVKPYYVDYGVGRDDWAFGPGELAMAMKMADKLRDAGLPYDITERTVNQWVRKIMAAKRN